MNYRKIDRQEFDNIVALDKNFDQLKEIIALARKIYGNSVYSILCTMDSQYNDEHYSPSLTDIEAMNRSGEWLDYNFNEDTIKDYLEKEPGIGYGADNQKEFFNDMFHYYLYEDYNESYYGVESMAEDDGYTFSFFVDDVNKNPLDNLYIGDPIDV